MNTSENMYRFLLRSTVWFFLFFSPRFFFLGSIFSVPLNTRSSFCFWFDCVLCVKFRFIHISFLFFECEKKWKWNKKKMWNKTNLRFQCAHCTHDDLGTASFWRTIVCTVCYMLCYSSRIETTTNVWRIHKNGIRILKTSNLKYNSSGSIYCVNLVCHVFLNKFFILYYLHFIRALGSSFGLVCAPSNILLLLLELNARNVKSTTRGKKWFCIKLHCELNQKIRDQRSEREIKLLLHIC